MNKQMTVAELLARLDGHINLLDRSSVASERILATTKDPEEAAMCYKDMENMAQKASVVHQLCGEIQEWVEFFKNVDEEEQWKLDARRTTDPEELQDGLDDCPF